MDASVRDFSTMVRYSRIVNSLLNLFRGHGGKSQEIDPSQRGMLESIEDSRSEASAKQEPI